MGGLQTAQSTFTQSPFHIDPRAGIDPAKQPRLERSFSFIYGTVIHGPDDAHVGGNGIPVQPAPQKIGLESLKPQRIDFLKGKRTVTHEIGYPVLGALVDMQGAHPLHVTQTDDHRGHENHEVFLS